MNAPVPQSSTVDPVSSRWMRSSVSKSLIFLAQHHRIPMDDDGEIDPVEARQAHAWASSHVSHSGRLHGGRDVKVSAVKEGANRCHTWLTFGRDCRDRDGLDAIQCAAERRSRERFLRHLEGGTQKGTSLLDASREKLVELDHVLCRLVHLPSPTLVGPFNTFTEGYFNPHVRSCEKPRNRGC